MLEIVEVKSKRQMRMFVSFPLELYKNCEYYVPALFGDEMNMTNPKKNAAAEGCKVKCFLAKKNSKVVGRVAGIIVEASNIKMNRKMIRFSRIDFVDDYEVSELLIKAVMEFGVSQGMTEIHGPWDFNDAGKEGLQISGFDTKSTFVTNYSYPYYKEHIERLGFVKEVAWNEYYIHAPKELNPRINKIADYVLEKYNLREAEITSMKKAIKEYGKPMFELYNRAYDELYATVHLSDRVVDQTISLFTFMLLPKYLSIVLDKDDKIVGLGVAISSIAEVIRECKGKIFSPKIFKLLHTIKHPKKLELALVAVTDEYRNKGLNAVMMRKIVNNAIADGVVGADTNPELETNRNVQSQWATFPNVDKTKTRQTYIMNINLNK